MGRRSDQPSRPAGAEKGSLRKLLSPAPKAPHSIPTGTPFGPVPGDKGMTRMPSPVRVGTCGVSSCSSARSSGPLPSVSPCLLDGPAPSSLPPETEVNARRSPVRFPHTFLCRRVIHARLASGPSRSPLLDPTPELLLAGGQWPCPGAELLSAGVVPRCVQLSPARPGVCSVFRVLALAGTPLPGL